MVLGVDLCYTRFMNNELLFKAEVYAIQGAIFEVYKHMGNAWHEEVYQQCLEREPCRRAPAADSQLSSYYQTKAGASR